MHPALSVIFFTVASGAGYGLLALTGVFAATGRVAEDGWFGFAALTLALGAIVFGLLSSTRHLGHPERAWRALSQWRSSWLSREGVAALASLVPAGLLGLVFLFGSGQGWPIQSLGLTSAGLSVVTVWCTAMIYRSLTPIRQWNHPLVVANYLALALMTGSLWCAAVATLSGGPAPLAMAVALVAIVIAAALKLAYWSSIDRAPRALTAADATGLRGPVRLFEAPHSQDNYLLKEMGFRIARKHAARLRRIAVIAGFVLPSLLVAVALLSSTIAAPAAVLAALCGTAGVLIERWLFFAEAKHTVTLYYGAASV